MGIDLRGISIAEGVRAALATAIFFAANEFINWPPLIIAAFGAMLTSFCDVGGPVRRRVPLLLVFAALGGVLLGGFGLMRTLPIFVILPFAGLLFFANAFVRVWGPGPQAVGNVLTIVITLALDDPLDLHTALVTTGAFVIGGLWAVLLTMGIWRIHPYRPAREAVSEVMHQLGALCADLLELVRRDTISVADWEAHARAHRRAARAALEQARDVVLGIMRQRGGTAPRGAANVLRLEASEQLFGALIALSDLLEHTPDKATRDVAQRLLRRLRPLLVVLSRAMVTERLDRLPRLTRAIAEGVADTADHPALHRIAGMIAGRLSMIVKLIEQPGPLPAGNLPGDAEIDWRTRVLGPLRANLTWNSAILRHAVRVAVMVTAALAFTLIWPSPYKHWLTFTVALTMQPFFAATWQRVLERTAGTVFGVVIATILAQLVQSPMGMAFMLFPLCVIGFAGRQVSYGFYIGCLTPLVVMVVDVVTPGQSELMIAGMRTLYSVLGGLLAVVGCFLLWPSWEPDRLRTELRDAIEAHAAFADAVLAGMLPDAAPSRGLDAAQRAAGVASNNLEASISRALQEPGRHRNRMESALAVDAALRRMGGRLTAMQLDSEPLSPGARVSWDAWRGWITESLRALAADPPRLLPPRPPNPPTDTPQDADTPQNRGLTRLILQVDLMAGALGQQPG